MIRCDIVTAGRRWVWVADERNDRLVTVPEVGSALRKLAARGVLAVDDARQRLHMFESLGIQHMHPPFLLRRAWEIANSHSLYTIYDASYAALSELTGTRLYTCDRALIEALNWSSDLVINPLATA
jgi:predicted nucleic acid-binding protein